MYLTHHTLTGVCSEIPLWQHVNRRMRPSLSYLPSSESTPNDHRQRPQDWLATDQQFCCRLYLTGFVSSLNQGHLPLSYKMSVVKMKSWQQMISINPNQYREKDKTPRAADFQPQTYPWVDTANCVFNRKGNWTKVKGYAEKAVKTVSQRWCINRDFKSV